MNLPKELTTVTPLSKALAFVLFILLPVTSFLIGIRYQQQNKLSKEIKIINKSLSRDFALNKYTDWKLYKNDEYKYILSYPPDWSLDSSDNKNIILLKQLDNDKYKKISISDTGVTVSSDNALLDMFYGSGNLFAKPMVTFAVDGRYGRIGSFNETQNEYIFVRNDNGTIHEFEFTHWYSDPNEKEVRQIISTFHFLSNDIENDTRYWKLIGNDLGVGYRHPPNWIAESNEEDKSMNFYLMRDVRDATESSNKIKKVFITKTVHGETLDEIINQYKNPKKIKIKGKEAVQSDNILIIQVNKSSLIYLEATSLEGLMKLDKILSTITFST